MYLLDTNVISEMKRIKSGKANQGVVNWLYGKPTALLYTCEIVVMELQRGILLKERKDPVQAHHLKLWLDEILATMFENRILTIDKRTTQLCASFHVPNPRPENDTWIASIAKANELILVTRNIKDFQDLPIKVINPFS